MDAGALLLATVVGAVVLFVWSAVCWMVLPHHKGDVRPAGDALTGCERALKKLAPGAWYLVPHFDDFGGMKSKKLGPRYEAGPNGLLIPFPPGPAAVYGLVAQSDLGHQ